MQLIDRKHVMCLLLWDVWRKKERLVRVDIENLRLS